MVLGEFKKKVMEEIKIGVVGLGYVGLPLARLFATKYAVVAVSYTHLTLPTTSRV